MFTFWISSNIFRNFSGFRRPILKCFDIIRFFFPLAFQRRIPSCSTAKTREATAKRKRKIENDVSAFLHFLDSFKHISFDFSGCRSPIFKCCYIIRFVFPLSFQCRIWNCSTAKTCEDIAKRKWKVKNYGWDWGMIVDKNFRGFQRAGL